MSLAFSRKCRASIHRFFQKIRLSSRLFGCFVLVYNPVMSVPAVWEAAGLSYAQFVNKCTVATRFAVRSELLASTYPLRRPFPEPAPAVSNGRQFFRSYRSPTKHTVKKAMQARAAAAAAS
eukprot:g42659.t1